MSSSNTQASLRTAGLGLLAMAIGSTVGPPAASLAHAARVTCTVTSASSTNIQTQDGFAESLINIAEASCGTDGPDEVTTPIEESISGVASAMAEAVAEVVSTCTGEGNAMASVAGFSRAEARADAVGRASARILTSSAVCQSCSGVLDVLVATVQNVSATAVAEANLEATFMFEEGEAQTVTAEDVQRSVEENIINLLATATGQIRISADNSCSADVNARTDAGTHFAECEVDISADQIIIEQTDAVADAGAAVVSMACEGDGGGAEVRVVAREIASATVNAVAQVDSFCEASGGPGTIACGLGNATVTAVARAQAEALAAGLATAMGPDCDCNLAANASAEMVEEIIAEATASALARTCVEEDGFAIESDFQFEMEETMGVAIAEVLASALSNADCTASVSACAQSGECVERFAQCSGPGVDGMLPCCDADDVCTSLLGSPAFRCQERALVRGMAGAEILECDP